MKLVFVHGRSRQGKNAQELRDRWEMALSKAWTQHGIAKPANIDVRFPFYGDTLDQFTNASQQIGGITTRGIGDVVGPLTDFEEEFLKRMIEKGDVTEEDIQAELPTHVKERGPQNWEWIQAGFRALSRKMPWVGRLGLRLLADVETYLTRPPARRAVNNIVLRELGGTEPVVVVGHSLGSVVSFVVLRDLAGKVEVPLLVTVGSPLGIDVVKQYLKPPPLSIPARVKSWLNGADQRDPVALFEKLDATTFIGGIENVGQIRNPHDDPHSITDYLSDPVICKRIAVALT